MSSSGKRVCVAVLGICAAAVTPPAAVAQPVREKVFTYQGQLKQNGAPASGPYDFKFAVYPIQAGGIAICEPVPFEGVQVTNGIFTVPLDFSGCPAENLFNGERRWLDVAVRVHDPNNPHSYTPLPPRQEIMPTPYSLLALDAASIGGWPVSTAQPADGKVLKWGGGNWAPADDAAAGSAGGDLCGTYPNPTVCSGAITTPKLAPNAVTNDKIQDGEVRNGDLATDAVTNAKIANNAVNTAELVDGAVTDAKVTNVAWSKITGKPTSFPPGGDAGGDLGGTYPNPVVDALQNRPVSNTAPSSGQVLKWNGSAWAPAAVNDPNSITTAMLAADAVTSAKLANDAASMWEVSGHNVSVDGASGQVGIDAVQGNASLVIHSNGPSPYDDFPLLFKNTHCTQTAGIQFNQVGYSDGNITFQRRFTNGLYDDDLMTISLYDGHVGIGTLSTPQMLTVNGNVQASCGILVCSDARYKKNVETLDGALQTVSKLRGVTFEWKRDEFPDHDFVAGRDIGFIAQEVEEVVPQVVSTGTDGYRSVDYGRLTPLLVEALHELGAEKDAQILDLRAENAELRTRLEKLESQVQRLAGAANTED